MAVLVTAGSISGGCGWLSSDDEHPPGEGGLASVQIGLQAADFSGNSILVSGERLQEVDGKYRCHNFVEPECLTFDEDGTVLRNEAPAVFTDLCPSQNFPEADWRFTYTIFADDACTEGMEITGAEGANPHNFICYNTSDIFARAFPNQSVESLEPGLNTNLVICISAQAEKEWQFNACIVETDLTHELVLDCSCVVVDGVCECPGGLEPEDLPEGCSLDPENDCRVVCGHDCDAIVVDGESIQAAIDAADPGDVICVEPGTYDEALTINKDITLLGPNFDVSPNPGGRGPEALITSPGENALFITDGSDLTFNGFLVRDVLRFALTQEVGSGGWGDIDMQYNIFRNAESVAGGYFWFRDDPGEFLVFRHNLLQDNPESNGLRIRAAQISDPSAGLVQVDISDNLWEDNGAWALNVNNVEGVIARNRVRNQTSAGVSADPDRQWGMLLATVNTNLLLEDNLFENLNGPGIYLHADFSGALSVTGNAFLTNVWGVLATGGAQVEGVAISINDFEGNDVAVQNNPVNALLDATSNWWGDASGPSGEGPGTGDPVSENVEFDPWLGSPSP